MAWMDMDSIGETESSTHHMVWYIQGLVWTDRSA